MFDTSRITISEKKILNISTFYEKYKITFIYEKLNVESFQCIWIREKNPFKNHYTKPRHWMEYGFALFKFLKSYFHNEFWHKQSIFFRRFFERRLSWTSCLHCDIRSTTNRFEIKGNDHQLINYFYILPKNISYHDIALVSFCKK